MSRLDLRAEDGVTLMELMVGAMIGTIMALGLFTFLDGTSQSSQQTAARVDAAKSGRPALAWVMDQLHTTCVAPDVAPILSGSTGTSISFIYQTGSSVTPTPNKRTISYDSAAKTLTDSVYPATGGVAPDWTFSSTPIGTANRIVLKPVTTAAISPSAVFRYYAYDDNGAISPTPLPVPLSDDDAARTVQVTVAFTVPTRISSDHASGDSTFTDTALLRFTPPGASADAENLPCA